MQQYVKQLERINEAVASEGAYKAARAKMDNIRKQNDDYRAKYNAGDIDRGQYEQWFKSTYLAVDKEFKIAEFTYNLDMEAASKATTQETKPQGEQAKPQQSAPGAGTQTPS